MDYNAQHLAIKTTQIRQFITYRTQEHEQCVALLSFGLYDEF